MKHFCLHSTKQQENLISQSDMLTEIFAKEGVEFSDEGCRECDSFSRISIIIGIENAFGISIPSELLSSELWESRDEICELVSQLAEES